jgi:hypothetical protein
LVTPYSEFQVDDLTICDFCCTSIHISHHVSPSSKLYDLQYAILLPNHSGPSTDISAAPMQPNNIAADLKPQGEAAAKVKVCAQSTT